MNNDTADAITVLQNLSSFVGAGGLDVTDVSSLDERIRWGIDVQVSVSIQRAAQIVEDCSKVPSTRWGRVKAAILGLDTCKHPYTRTTSLAAQDGLVERVARAMYEDFWVGNSHDPIPWEFTSSKDIWLKKAKVALSIVREN